MFFKSKKFYIILAIVVIGLLVGYNKYSKSKQPISYDTVKVMRGDLVQTVDATGKIESSNNVALRFQTGGQIAALRAKEGQQVRVGESLANLRLSELDAAVAQASANLNKQLAGQTPEYLAQLKAALDKAKYDLNQVQGDVPGADNSKLVQNAYDNLYLSLEALQINLASSLTASDNVLGVDNTLANDSFEVYLSVQSPTVLNTAKSKYLMAKNVKTEFDVAINAISKSSSHASIDAVVKVSEKAVNTMKECLFYTASALDNTQPIGSLTQATLDTLKTDIQTARTNLSTKYSSVVSDMHSTDTAYNSYASYQSLVDKAQAAYDDAKNPPRDVDVASYRAALAAAVASREKAVLKAPIEGVITKIDKKLGEVVTPTDDIMQILSPHYEIKVDVPETDVAKIKIGDPAQITLDAFGEDIKFAGKIDNIELGSTEIQDVVYYKVKIILADTDKPIKPGMTANLVIKTKTVAGALYIPFRSVRNNGGKKVQILENGVAKDVEVTLGLRADDGKVEVLTGLKEGDEVIIGTKTK